MVYVYLHAKSPLHFSFLIHADTVDPTRISTHCSCMYVALGVLAYNYTTQMERLKYIKNEIGFKFGHIRMCILEYLWKLNIKEWE